jgi:hypothetical protein
LVKLKVDPKTLQGLLRHEDVGTTMELYAQADMECMRDAQGKFLEQVMGDIIHLLTAQVQRESWVGSWVEDVRVCAAKSFGMMVARDGVEPPTPAFSGLRSTT